MRKPTEKYEKTVELLKQGYKPNEIRIMLGWKSVTSVHTIAKKIGLSKKEKDAEVAKQIDAMLRQGKTRFEAQTELNQSWQYVNRLIKQYGIQYEGIERACSICGRAFIVKDENGQKYCSDDCRRVASHRTNENANDNGVAEKIGAKFPDWEYIGGYTGSDGTMVIRHKVCGFTTMKSCVTLRHNQPECFLCKHLEIKQRKEREKEIQAKQIEARRFYQPVKKVKVQRMTECKVCGSFFFNDRKTYCSDECARKGANHYHDMKKRKRMRDSWTEESKTISLDKLFDRDGGICWLCGKACDIEADPNSNNYPSIDHIVPISLGGKDEWQNIKLAHRICNSLRGNAVAE